MWMVLESIKLCEISHIEKYVLLCLTRGIKNETNKFIQQNRNRLTDVENKLMVTGEEREWGGGK